jgi:hypothetical protein
MKVKLFTHLLAFLWIGMGMWWVFPVLRCALDEQDGDVHDYADTLDAIVAASGLPISIVVAGLSSKVSNCRWMEGDLFW